MRKLALALFSVSLLCSCAGQLRKDMAAATAFKGPYPALATSPAEVEAYLKRNVGARKLQKWNGHVSDDTLVIDVVTNGASTSVGTAK